MAASVLGSDIQCRVSSVLNRDVKQFGKKHLLDGDVETSWNSDELQFQGGFVGKGCWLEGDLCLYQHSFPVPGSPVLERLRVVFSSSTDFFGRVVVYQFDVLGEVM
uniref:Nuclear receptor 2C2-associated protein n=1 Tax=Eptatretus burgeri TaxID=7764 RepID=A0A8C4Q994_EPTBU